MLFSSPSVMSDSLQTHRLQHTRFPFLAISQSLLKLKSIELVMTSNHLILYHPVLILHSIFPSIRAFSSESLLHISWPKCWSFSFNISPPNEYLGLISFRIDWFDFLPVQGTLKSLLQHHSSKSHILWRSAFFMDQLSFSYMTTGKTIALDYMNLCRQNNVSVFLYAVKVVIGFLPRSKSLLISCSHHLQGFWSPRQQSLTLFPLFSHLFVIK